MKIFIHHNFKKYYLTLRNSEKERFKERRDLFQKTPFHPRLNNHALSGKYRGYRSINATGDLRVIYEPVGKDAALFIIIDTQSNLYK